MPDRIRVFQMVYSFDIEAGGGGVTRFTTSLAQKLDPQQFEVILGCLADYGSTFGQDRMDQFQAGGFQVFRGVRWIENRPYLSFYRAWRALQEFCRQVRPQIIHSHSEFTDVAALALKARRLAAKIVRTAHNGHWLEWPKRPLRRAVFTNFLYPLCYDAEIGVSPAVAARLDRRLLARKLKKKALQINNAIDLERFGDRATGRKRMRQELGIPEDAPVLGSIGRLTEEKAFDCLVAAAAQVMEVLPSTRLVIVGAGPLEAALKAQAAALGIAPQCIFTGPRSEVEDLLDAMDVFICTSRWEGLPTAVLESMAAGTPVIASDIPGVRALIPDGCSGLLIKPGDVTAYSRAALHLLGSPAAGQAYAHAARAAVRSFSIEEVAKIHETVDLNLTEAFNAQRQDL